MRGVKVTPPFCAFILGHKREEQGSGVNGTVVLGVRELEGLLSLTKGSEGRAGLRCTYMSPSTIFGLLLVWASG